MIIEKKWWAYIFIALICTAGIFINGYKYGTRDSILYIPIIEKAANPELFSEDYLFEEPSHSYSLWFPAMSAFVRFFPTETVFFAGYILCIFALYLAVYHLSLNLFNSRPAAFLALLILVNCRFVGGTTITTFEIVHTVRTPALPFAIAFFIPFCKGRLVLSAVLAGIAFVIHPITALLCVCLLFYRSLISGLNSGFWEFIKPVGVFLAIITPLLVQIFLVSHASVSELNFFSIQDSAWNQIIRARLPYAFLSNWKDWEWRIVFHYLLVLLTILAVRGAIGHFRQKDTTAYDVILANVFLFSICAIFVDLYPVPLLVQLQVSRAFCFVIYFFIIYAAWLLWDGFEKIGEVILNIDKEQADKPLRPMLLGVPAIQFALTSLVTYAGVVVMIFLVTERQVPFFQCTALLAWLFFVKEQQIHLNGKFFAATFALLITMLFLKTSSGGNSFLGISMVAFLCFEIIRLCSLNFKWKSLKRITSFNLVIIPMSALLVGVGLISLKMHAHNDFAGHLQLPCFQSTKDWTMVQKWCRENTPDNATFLVPFHIGGFRVHSQRSVVGEWKDGGPGIFSKSFAKKWFKRGLDLSGYNNYDKAKIIEMKNKYGADHAVTQKKYKFDFPLLYQNNGYNVYALKTGY